MDKKVSKKLARMENVPDDVWDVWFKSEPSSFDLINALEKHVENIYEKAIEKEKVEMHNKWCKQTWDSMHLGIDVFDDGEIGLQITSDEISDFYQEYLLSEVVLECAKRTSYDREKVIESLERCLDKVKAIK